MIDLDILINNFNVADVEFNENEEAFNYFEDVFNDLPGLAEDYVGELFYRIGIM
ncbi:hypothetical protein [Reichenbachiella sp.]|uniref:hypothetical protein n=1 Tax=Reichenbachiella sp. TaxID=2184521 RepID=UPI00329A4276